VTCFSFYANKTITTGEGGMAVTSNEEIARRIRRMSLHGLSRDAWSRNHGSASWDYRIVEPGYKYNLTDIAAAIGIHQLERAEELRRDRQAIARFYFEALAELSQLELPADSPERVHAWHLYPIRLQLRELSVDRDSMLEALRCLGVHCSVHWRPLHLHPYYAKTFGWTPSQFPAASSVWLRLVSLPLFPGMRQEEQECVVGAVRKLCARYATQTRSGGNGRPKKSKPDIAAV
jgi:perosamine synthetase